MDIMDFLTAGPNTPFLVTGCVVLALLIISILSTIIGVGHELFHIGGDIDLTADLNGNGIPDHLEVGHVHLMAWLNPSHVPSTVFIILFCGIYSIFGYSAQWLTHGLFGILAPAVIAGPVIAALALPAVRGASIAIAPALPRDETNAIAVETLVGSAGIVTAGPIGPADFGIARFTDAYGTDHSLMVCGEGEEAIANGASVVLLGPHREREIAFVVRKI